MESQFKHMTNAGPNNEMVHTQNQAKEMAESVLESPKIGIPGVGQLVSEIKGLKLEANQRTGKENKSINEEKKGDTIIFVGDLSRTVKDKDLRAVMELHGSVVNVDIKRDRVTNNNLGYGFVQFETHEQALKAKKALHGVEVSGRKIRTGWAQRNTTLFVGDLDNTIDATVYRTAFSRYGNLVDDETYFKVDKGFGMVKFKTRENAETAKVELNGKRIGQSKRPVRVIWGDTSVQKHCVHVKFDVGKEVKSIQESEISEDVLQKVFQEYGQVLTVNLPRHSDNTLKGYGFVHFEDTEKGEESAKKAIANLSGTKIGRLVVQCNYGRKHSKRRPRNGSTSGGSGSSMRQHNHMYMYQYPPKNGGYPMMYPVQTPYMYQQQVRGGRPGPYSPYGYLQMGYYHHSQYGQSQTPNGNVQGSQDMPNDLAMDYITHERGYDSHVHGGVLHEAMPRHLHQR